MKVIFCILLLMLVPPVLTAQGASYSLEKFNGAGDVGMAFSEMRKKKDVKSDLPTSGSVYLDERFVPCTIYYNEELVGHFYYRHNAYNDEIEIKDTQLEEEPESSLATLKQLRLVDDLDKKELSLKIYKNDDGEARNGYLYKLIDGEPYRLYFKNNVKFTEGTHPVTSMTRPTPNKFTHFTEYYYSTGDHKVAQYINPKKKVFLKAFPRDQREKLKAFLKEEKRNPKREEDLIAIFTWLNSL